MKTQITTVDTIIYISDIIQDFVKTAKCSEDVKYIRNVHLKLKNRIHENLKDHIFENCEMFETCVKSLENTKENLEYIYV